MERMGFELEPRIMEHMIVLGYRIAGGEYFWIPRALSSAFWVAGGLFLYLIALKITSPAAALCAAVFYLFLPFGISASRTFQPDPLMIMLLMCSVYLLLRYFERPSVMRIISAAVVSTLAMFIKPYGIFVIFGFFLAAAIYRNGIKKVLTDRDVYIFTILSIAPAASYYLYDLVSNTGFVGEHTRVTFVPHLLLEPFYWKGWLEMIGHVIGYIPFLCGLVFFLMMRSGQLKAILAGLWIGYLMFGLMFTFHIHTHTYYHLQFIPVVALSLSPLGEHLSGVFHSKKRLLVSGMILSVFIIIAGIGMRNIDLRNHKDQLKSAGAIIGVNPEFYRIFAEDYRRDVEIDREIGRLVGHGINNVFLTSDFGRSLAYHGELAGWPWPIARSLEERKKRGVEIPPKKELFNSRYLTIRTHGAYIRYKPDFFIVTALDEFYNQPDLKNFLESNFPVISASDDYLVFDLRKMSQ